MISPKEALSSLVCRAMKPSSDTPCTAAAVLLVLASGASSLRVHMQTSSSLLLLLSYTARACII